MSSVPPRVLVTRARHQASDLAEELRARGAEPVLLPVIETIEPTSFAVLDDAIANLDSFDWLLFTSANAVETFGSRVAAAGGNLSGGACGCGRLWSIAAIGPSTARALEKLGLTSDIVPQQAVAESLTGSLLAYVRQANGAATRFLLVRAEEAREHLPETLRAAGAEVTVAPAYRTVMPEGSIHTVKQLFAPDSHPVGHLTARSIPIGPQSSVPSPGNSIDAITFTSSSSVRNLVALCEAGGVLLPETAVRISIGPVTSQTLRDLGLPPHAEAAEASVAALAEATLTTLRKK